MTVRVVVVHSRCHLPSIELELLHFGLETEDVAPGGKVNLAQEVLRQRKEELQRIEAEREAELIPNLSMELAKVLISLSLSLSLSLSPSLSLIHTSTCSDWHYRLKWKSEHLRS